MIASTRSPRAGAPANRRRPALGEAVWLQAAAGALVSAVLACDWAADIAADGEVEPASAAFTLV